MFGNVLNLSHLAHLLGEERPFYALQARGLYGDLEPHETFEEMARDYVAEIRMVQPQGPYLLGGFSGGGVTAYEMARQLLADGERIQKLVMLDTPVPEFPELSSLDKISMLHQGFKREGLEYLRRKLRNRRESVQHLAQQRQADLQEGPQQRAQFHSHNIGEAFLRALRRYALQPIPVEIALYRPKLDIRYRLSGGRLLNRDRVPLHRDNGWTPYASRVDVTEVPGDHDSMVLEPNVRVLVSAMKRTIAGSFASSNARFPHSKP
jgi:thioesterase domain-containing protein